MLLDGVVHHGAEALLDTLLLSRSGSARDVGDALSISAQSKPIARSPGERKRSYPRYGRTHMTSPNEAGALSIAQSRAVGGEDRAGSVLRATW